MVSRGSEVGYTLVNLQKSKLEFDYSAKGRQRRVVCRETDPTTGRKVRHVLEFYRKSGDIDGFRYYTWDDENEQQDKAFYNVSPYTYECSGGKWM